MSRQLDSALVTVAESKVFPPVWFVWLDWPTGAVRVWSGYGSIDWGGHTWLGVGTLGEIGQISESSDLSVNSVDLKISGISSAEIAEALDGTAQGRAGVVYLSALNPDGTLVATPKAVFSGFINYPVIEDSGPTSSITVTLAKEFSQRNQQPRRNTHEDQQIDHPGDMFFEFLAANATKEFSWGHIPTAAGNSAGDTGPNSGSRTDFD